MTQPCPQTAHPYLHPTPIGRVWWLYLLNRCVLQWLCVRIYRTADEATGRTIPGGWGLLRWVVPLSGYGRPMRYFGPRASDNVAR